MTTYTDWNQALISYFISGVPRGTKVYLSVDEDVIEHIGYNFIGSSLAHTNWVDDFNNAVKRRVVVNEQVDLNRLKGRNAQGFPQGVAFLCASVLAAGQMAQDKSIDQKDYFKRLREILSLPGSGRPQGMNPGTEEPLWQEWNRWLMEQGFLSSAQQGKGGSTIYINYPISQCLLRRTDKDKLRQLFEDKKWQAQWDAPTLFIFVCKEVGILGKHLRDLLTEDRERNDSLAEEIYQVYEQWEEQRYSKNKNCYSYSLSRNLSCGLYRTENFLGEVNYSLYPKHQRRCKPELIAVKIGQNHYQLRQERPGWYYPLAYSVNEIDLETGCKYKINSPNNLDYLILPDRDFWILIPDPENPDSGAFASWGKPSLGNEFILLCKRELLSDIHHLRDENLLEWSSQPNILFNNQWLELNQCMVVSSAWDEVIIKNQSLKDGLQPSVSLSISLSGGLRIPQIDAWLIEYSPQITIFCCSSTAQVKVTELANGRVIIDEPYPKNTPISISLPHTGEYIVQAVAENKSTPPRLIRVVDWNNLELQKSNIHEFMNINDKNKICGSLIEEVH